MTEEIIKAITEAEAEGVAKKVTATEEAAKIVKNAEMQATEIEKASAEFCKNYREKMLAETEANAQRIYLETLEKARLEAKEYCRDILSKAETSVSKIVGRITSGDY